MTYLEANGEAYRKAVAAELTGYVPAICPVTTNRYIVVGRVPADMTGVYTEAEAIANLERAIDNLIEMNRLA